MSSLVGVPRCIFPSDSASRGFSLVELMVVLAILGIMAGIAIPAYQDFILQQRVHSATISLQSALALARSESVKRNAQLTISAVNADWSAGWSIARPGGGALILSQSSLPGVAIAEAGGAVVVAFSRTGRSTLTTFIVSAEEDSAVTSCLQLEASGRAVSKRGGC